MLSVFFKIYRFLDNFFVYFLLATGCFFYALNYDPLYFLLGILSSFGAASASLRKRRPS